jgi:hypothetical protein
MLADTPFPRGYDATLAGMGTLSEGFERFVASPLYLVGYTQWDARFDLFLLCQTIISSSFTGRSLHCLVSRLIKFSRVQHHGEVCPLSRSVMLSTERRNRYLLRYRAAFASSPISCPHRHRSPLRLTFPLVFSGNDTGLSCSVAVTYQ